MRSDIKLYSRTVLRGRYVEYETSIGKMGQHELADYLGITSSCLMKRVKRYGVTSPAVLDPSVRGRQPKDGRPDWGGLSERVRIENLRKLDGKTASYFLENAPDK
jgi:hypothetical protein